jgi:hypothetical protein
MLRIAAIIVAVLTVPLALFMLYQRATIDSPFATQHGKMVGSIVIVLLLAQLPTLWLRRWGWSLGAVAMMIALTVLDFTVLDPPERCGDNCIIIRGEAVLKNS